MRAWLLKTGEPMPMVTGRPDRLMRVGLVADRLASSGHDVVWWASTWEHLRKTALFRETTRFSVTPTYHIELLHGIDYHRNVSIRRLVNHRQVAREFSRLAPTRERPTVIFCALPTPELARAAIEYGAQAHVPVVLDLRDMWPDLIVDRLAPEWARGLARMALWPMYRDVLYACRHATALTGITEPFVDWGLRYAGRARSPRDRVFHLAYAPKSLTDGERRAANEKWDQRGLHAIPRPFIACYLGALGPHIELEAIVRAAQILNRGPRDIRFVLCGNGDRIDWLRRKTTSLENVMVPGWVDQLEIAALLERAQVGLATFRDSANYRANLPNKVGEYLSAGLPIVSTLPGLLEQLLARERCGVTVPNNDGAALAAKLCELYDQPAALADMSIRSQELFADQFSAERVYGALAEYLAEF